MEHKQKKMLKPSIKSQANLKVVLQVEVGEELDQEPLSEGNIFVSPLLET